MSNKKGLLALSPLIILIALITLFTIYSVQSGDQGSTLSLTVAFMISSIYAVAISGGMPIKKRIDTYSKGAGANNLMLMLWIYVLAGAFAASAKAMGAVDATVNLALNVLPANMILPGLFLAACFISVSIGTSVGTVVALVPIAAGLAHSMDANIGLMTAIIVGGAYFGDNLSFISDTTVVATQTQSCRMSDKFRVNSMIVIPAAIVILIVYAVMGYGYQAPTHVASVDIWKVVPYLVVLITAIAGINVMAVLSLGTILCGIIGIASHYLGAEQSYDVFGWFSAMGNGITGMGELLHRQQHRSHPHRRQHSQEDRRQVWCGQPQGCQHSRHLLLYRAGLDTLRCADALGSRTGGRKPDGHPALSLLSSGNRHRCPTRHPPEIP